MNVIVMLERQLIWRQIQNLFIVKSNFPFWLFSPNRNHSSSNKSSTLFTCWSQITLDRCSNSLHHARTNNYFFSRAMIVFCCVPGTWSEQAWKPATIMRRRWFRRRLRRRRRRMFFILFFFVIFLGYKMRSIVHDCMKIMKCIWNISKE